MTFSAQAGVVAGAGVGPDCQRPAVRPRALLYRLGCCVLCAGLVAGGVLAQRRQPVAELDRVTLTSGKTLVGLIVREDADHLVLKMKLPTAFISFTLLTEEVTRVRRASEAGRALTEAEWKKLEADLARRARAARRSTDRPTRPAPAEPRPRPPTTPKSPRDILLAEARRLGLAVPPDTSTEELQRLVQAEQARRHQEAVKLFDQAVDAFSEASAELPTLAYYRRSGRSVKLVYRKGPLTQAVAHYRKAYELLGRAAELDPAAKPRTEQYRSNILLVVHQLELLVRHADMVEEDGSRRTNPDRR